MPFCFSFPPMVAATGSPMRPMVDSVVSAFCDHCTAANGALGREAGLSFTTFSSNDSKFHLLSFQGANALNQLPDSTGQLRDEAEAHQLVAGSCFSSALARRTRSLVVNGGCRVALCFYVSKLSVGRDLVNNVIGDAHFGS